MTNKDLTHYFREENFLPELKANNKDDLLEEMIKPLLDQNIIKKRGVILETLKKRETLGSTGIGFGVAIPHCRTLTVSDIQLVVGVSKDGIEYDAIDDEKVTLFFLIIAPPQEKSNLYLPLLGNIVELLRKEEIRETLKSLKEFSSFIDTMNGE